MLNNKKNMYIKTGTAVMFVSSLYECDICNALQKKKKKNSENVFV